MGIIKPAHIYLLAIITAFVFNNCQPPVGKTNDSQTTSSEINPCSAIGWIGGSSNGWKIDSITPSGPDYQSFCLPTDICIDVSGNIYIVENGNNRISKWDKDGNAIGWIGGGSIGWKTLNAPTEGTDYQSFYYPNGIFVDSFGNIFVADTLNNRISKWDKDGNTIGWIGGGSNGWKTSGAPAADSDYQSFNMPTGIFLDSSGNIYVVDSGNFRISKWDKDGNAVGWIGGGCNGWKTSDALNTQGKDYKNFYSPFYLCLDSSGNIFITDNNRISKWDKDGNAVGWIGGGSNGWKTSDAPTSGSGYQYLNNGTTGICLDSSGSIYISDVFNNRICKWDKDGNAIGWIGGGSNNWKKTTAPGSYGKDYKSFYYTYGVRIDNLGYIYIADQNNSRICKWK